MFIDTFAFRRQFCLVEIIFKSSLSAGPSQLTHLEANTVVIHFMVMSLCDEGCLEGGNL